MVFEIYEENIERLEKKLKRIENKCIKYGCEFHYERLGEVFHEKRLDNGSKINIRFIQVEASGIAVVDGWEFVASLENTDSGNIVKGIGKYEVPTRYYECAPYCEYCKTNKYRKYSYVVRNVETGEYKQVGKSCLKDFTNGFSAEDVARYVSWFDELIRGEAPYEGSDYTRWYETEEVARYIAETIRHFGYVKTDSMATSTKEHATDFLLIDHGDTSFFSKDELERRRDEMERFHFDPESDYAVETARKVLDFARNWEDMSNYAHNLKVVANEQYLKHSSLGILASAFPAYDREVEKLEALRRREEKRAEEDARSEHVGNVGDRVTVDIAEAVCVTSWETIYGWTGIWKITDTNGCVFTWKSGNVITDGAKKIVGTVKGHSEFRGCKQTELTRCRVS